MEIVFRRATPNDALSIAQLMMFAMDKIVYDFIGEQNETKAITFLENLIAEENNQYSYQNITVVEDDKHQIVGMFNVYDGADLHRLRQPVLALLAKDYNQVINPQDETEAGEFYIDTIAVSPACRGFGIGQRVLDYIIEKYSTTQPVGLLVDLDNPNAKKLYLNKGFVKVGKKQLMNEFHEHLQFKSN